MKQLVLSEIKSVLHISEGQKEVFVRIRHYFLKFHVSTYEK